MTNDIFYTIEMDDGTIYMNRQGHDEFFSRITNRYEIYRDRMFRTMFSLILIRSTRRKTKVKLRKRYRRQCEKVRAMEDMMDALNLAAEKITDND